MTPKLNWLTYLRPKSCKCCPISRMTSSSDWDSRFFFLTPELASDVLLVLLDAGWADTPLLLLLLMTVFPLLVTDRSPLEWAAPVEDDSPFCAPLRQDSSESRSCPAPLACMLTRFMEVTQCRNKTMTGATGHCGESKISAAAADRPTDPDAAPNCPVPPAAESPCLFRDDNPVFELDVEQTEAGLISTTAFCENSMVSGAVRSRYRCVK